MEGNRAQGAAPVASEAAPAPDELSSPQEDKRRALRQAALTAVLKGTKHVEQRGASTVVNLGTKVAKGKSSERVDKYVELGREKTDKIFTILAEFGDKRHPTTPTRTPTPSTPDVRGRRPAAQRDSRAGPRERQQHRLAGGLQPEHFQDLYFGTGKDASR